MRIAKEITKKEDCNPAAQPESSPCDGDYEAIDTDSSPYDVDHEAIKSD